ncbi:unnamed protein product, partial [Rotaria sp. Silwood2]
MIVLSINYLFFHNDLHHLPLT